MSKVRNAPISKLYEAGKVLLRDGREAFDKLVPVDQRGGILIDTVICKVNGVKSRLPLMVLVSKRLAGEDVDIIVNNGNVAKELAYFKKHGLTPRTFGKETLINDIIKNESSPKVKAVTPVIEDKKIEIKIPDLKIDFSKINEEKGK